MRMLSFVFPAAALAACAGAIDASPVPGPVPILGVTSAKLTEPWKSMDFPVEGALVEESSPTSLVVRFPAVSADDLGAAYAVFKQSLLDAGWTAHSEELGLVKQLDLTAPDGKVATLSVLVDDGRPLAMITVIP